LIQYITLGVLILVLSNLLYLTRTVATLQTEVGHIKNHLGCGGKAHKKSKRGREAR
jgi:hypothetical protein